MKVQTKITFLLGVVVAAFLGGLFAFRLYDQFKFHRIARERLAERQRSLEQFLDYNGAPLKTLVEDSTCWDGMARAMTSNDGTWLGQNINRSTLDSFHAHAIWIFGSQGQLLYPLTYADFAGLHDFSIPGNRFRDIFAKSPLVHFFVNSPYGVIEIRGGTIHPSRDFKRETPAAGYFFAGRIWNQPTLDEMAIFTGDSLRVVAPSEASKTISNDERNGTIAFGRELNGWDGAPVAQLLVRNESPVVQELNQESQVSFVALILFALLLLLLISLSLSGSVRKPLGYIMKSLSEQDPRCLDKLMKDTSEFGELARTVRAFLSQRDSLLREIEERCLAEATLKKKEEELRQSQKMEAIGQLAGGVAHDFNNLLTAILGYAELIALRASRDPTVRQHAGLIAKAGQQAATLTRQLLAFSRKQILQPRVLDLNELVVEMEKLLKRVIGERYRIQTRSEAVDGRVRADPAQIEQVLLNLGVNARDAMPEGGSVIIRTSNENLSAAQAARIGSSIRAGDYVVLSVKDTGIGMDSATRARIFEPFFTTKGPGKGTGLGLATVYGIVRQSGGGISVETEPGQGTTFRIYLPFERAPIDQVKPGLRPSIQTNNSETILVVEDDEAVRHLVCDVLEDSGYTVLCADDGPDAIRRCEKYEGEIHLLITDVIMPKVNGPALARTLCPIRPEMRVLYVSGYSANDLGDHGVLPEDIELLQKPFSPHTLLDRVRSVLESVDEWSLDGEVNSSQLQFSI